MLRHLQPGQLHGLPERSEQIRRHHSPPPAPPPAFLHTVRARTELIAAAYMCRRTSGAGPSVKERVSSDLATGDREGERREKSRCDKKRLLL